MAIVSVPPFGIASRALMHKLRIASSIWFASAIAGGYAVLLSSWGFKVHIWFGLLTVTAMMISAISALTLLPSLIWTLRPRFVFGVGHDSRTHPR